MISLTEENYLKAIYKISEKQDSNKPVSTNAVSKEIKTSAASVTDMLKRLSEKDLINYEKYKGVSLTKKGTKVATNLIRKHRLWEVFLVQQLKFSWDEVHEVAEQLEHIKSETLVRRLDDFLDNPKFDPHGDPIPDEDGNMTFRKQSQLSEMEEGQEGVVVGVTEDSTPFLQYLTKLGLELGSKIKIMEKYEYDNSIKIKMNKKKEQILTEKISQNLLIKIKGE